LFDRVFAQILINLKNQGEKREEENPLGSTGKNPLDSDRGGGQSEPEKGRGLSVAEKTRLENIHARLEGDGQVTNWSQGGGRTNCLGRKLRGSGKKELELVRKKT